MFEQGYQQAILCETRDLNLQSPRLHAKHKKLQAGVLHATYTIYNMYNVQYEPSTILSLAFPSELSNLETRT